MKKVKVSKEAIKDLFLRFYKVQDQVIKNMEAVEEIDPHMFPGSF
jgi:hypothetical protein